LHATVPVGEVVGDTARVAALILEERLVIELVLDGHVHYFRKLVDRYQASVRGIIHRLVGSPTEAEDLAQQSFMSAFHALRDFQTGLRFSSWLYRIAINAAKDHLKSKKRGEQPLDDDASAEEAAFAGHIADPESVSVAAERHARLHEAIQHLPWKYREVLVLKDIEELSYDEIQSVLALPRTTLKIRVLRARDQLRSILAGLEGA
jgi:RNA polymerase sigma-70 factor (ECF subfamily)